MKPYLTLAIMALALGSAQAAVTVGLSDLTGDPGSATILPGGSFTVRVTLNSTTELTTGIGYLLQAMGSGNGQFRITARDITESVFSDLTTSNGIALSPALALLDPANDNDLGGLVGDVLTPNAAGNFFVADLTIESLGTIAPGNYTLSTSGVVVSDDAFDTINVGDSGYSVNVVPEASHAMLSALGALGLVARRRRK